LIDIEPAGKFMFLAWFTYTEGDAADANEQHWFTAQGNYSGNTAELILYETLGGQFDDPQAVNTNPVGNITLSFADCASGSLSYAIDSWGVQGSFPLVRAIPGTEDVCLELGAGTPDRININDVWDGAWYNAETPGQGLLFDVLTDSTGDDFIFAAWFTYGDNSVSGQRWLTAQGPLAGTFADVPVYETTGGSFVSPGFVGTTVAGSMTIEFSGCNSAQMTYSLNDGSPAGNIQLERAIPGTDALCQERNGQEN